MESQLTYMDEYNFCWHSISLLTTLHEAGLQFNLNLGHLLQSLGSSPLDFSNVDFLYTVEL